MVYLSRFFVMKKTEILFDIWNEKKKNIEFVSRKSLNVRAWEFWRYREGVNVGNEISKDGAFRRPCLVLKTNTWNGLFLVIPITTKYKHWLSKYLLPLHNYRYYWLKQCWLVLNQIKLIDRKRLYTKTWVYNPHYNLVRLVITAYKKFL